MFNDGRVLVGKRALDGSNDTFGTDAKHVQKLLWFAAPGHAAHSHSLHHYAGLLTHCSQDGLTQTTYKEDTKKLP